MQITHREILHGKTSGGPSLSGTGGFRRVPRVRPRQSALPPGWVVLNMVCQQHPLPLILCQFGSITSRCPYEGHIDGVPDTTLSALSRPILVRVVRGIDRPQYACTEGAVLAMVLIDEIQHLLGLVLGCCTA